MKMMMSGIRFHGNFSVEKKHLQPNQLAKLPEKIPGQYTEILNDDELLLLHTQKDDAKISAFFRQNAISYTWSQPAERKLIM
jgi:hypothetical protein